MKHVIIFFIRLYQKIISRLKPSCCRFYPTCSCYAVTAYSRFGFFRGTLLSFLRIIRCNPFCRAGNDPVPVKFTLRRK